jgi:signal transduction histidine kinase
MGPAIVAPLAIAGRVVGTLLVANRVGGRHFTPDDLDIVESFTAPVAVALEYARAQDELKRLAVMDDRERIAKELHDGVIQSLFAVGMGLQGTAALAHDPAVGDRITGAVGELDRVIRDLRNYIFGLRPGILADRQLDQALHALAEDFSDKTGVVVVVDIDPEVAADLGSRAGDVVQMAREALSNVGRHAEASTTRLSLHRRDGDAILEIDDDGKGFDPGTVDPSGHGMRNLQGRAETMGGAVEVTSSPAEGTTVTVRMPLSATS